MPAEKTLPGRGDFMYGVASGPSWSTEFAVAARIASLSALDQEGGPHGEVGPRLAPLPEDGGAAALADLVTSPTTDLAIVPLPLLEVKARATPSLRARVGYVAPLYVQTVHVLARGDVGGLRSLDGRRVAVGSPDGVGAILLRALGIRVTPVYASGPDLVAEVREGRADAAVVVSGDPVGPLASVPSDAGLRLLPVPYEDALGPGFLPATLGHAAYPGLVAGADVPTVSVQAVLAAYLRYPRGERAGTLGALLISVLNHASSPEGTVAGDKLRDVNWAATVPGWRRLPSVQSWLDARAKAARTIPPRP